MSKILATIILLFNVVVFASGHGLGQSFEKEVTGYVVDIGYDAPGAIISGQTIRFDFNLWSDKGKEEIADFSYVWVRIAPREGISFASFLHYPKPLLTGMSYTFQKSGQYELTARFLDKNDKALAEVSFPLIVERGEFERQLLLQGLGAGFGGLALGFLIALLLRKKSLIKV